MQMTAEIRRVVELEDSASRDIRARRRGEGRHQSELTLGRRQLGGLRLRGGIGNRVDKRIAAAPTFGCSNAGADELFCAFDGRDAIVQLGRHGGGEPAFSGSRRSCDAPH